MAMEQQVSIIKEMFWSTTGYCLLLTAAGQLPSMTVLVLFLIMLLIIIN